MLSRDIFYNLTGQNEMSKSARVSPKSEKSKMCLELVHIGRVSCPKLNAIPSLYFFGLPKFLGTFFLFMNL